MPIARTVTPLNSAEFRKGIQLSELFLAGGTLNLRVSNRCRFVRRGIRPPDANGDGNRRLNVEDIGRLAGSKVVAAQIDDPNRIEGLPHDLSHTNEPRAGQIA